MNTQEILNKTKAVAIQLLNVFCDDLVTIQDARAYECFTALNDLYKGVKPINLDDTDFTDPANAVIYMSRKRGNETRVDTLAGDELLGVIAHFLKEARASRKSNSGSRYYYYLNHISDVFQINKTIPSEIESFELSKDSYFDDLFQTAFKGFNDMTNKKLSDLIIDCIDLESDRVCEMLNVSKQEKLLDHHYILSNLYRVIQTRIKLNENLSESLIKNLKSIYREYKSEHRPRLLKDLFARIDIKNNSKDNEDLYDSLSEITALNSILKTTSTIEEKHKKLFKNFINRPVKAVDSSMDIAGIEGSFNANKVNSLSQLISIPDAGFYGGPLNVPNLAILDLALKFSTQITHIWPDLSELNKTNLLYLYDQIDTLKTLCPQDIWFKQAHCSTEKTCAEQYLSKLIPDIDLFMKSVVIYKTLSNNQILGPSEYKSLLDTHLVGNIESMELQDFNS